jgi:hypothetical protein
MFELQELLSYFLNFAIFYQKSPNKNLFELQELLKKNSEKKPKYIKIFELRELLGFFHLDLARYIDYYAS